MLYILIVNKFLLVGLKQGLRLPYTWVGPDYLHMHQNIVKFHHTCHKWAMQTTWWKLWVRQSLPWGWVDSIGVGTWTTQISGFWSVVIRWWCIHHWVIYSSRDTTLQTCFTQISISNHFTPQETLESWN